MSSFVVLPLALLALLALALLLLARSPVWSRLVLAVLLTRLFDRPEPMRPLRRPV
jgi:hypothetical protein